jgi:hypothetical protein
VLGGLAGILEHEQQPPQPPPAPAPMATAEHTEFLRAAYARVRRAAAQALRQVIQGDAGEAPGRGGGGGRRELLHAAPEQLRAAFHLLQRVRDVDGDAIVRAHANDALACVDALLSGAAGLPGSASVGGAGSGGLRGPSLSAITRLERPLQ